MLPQIRAAVLLLMLQGLGALAALFMRRELRQLPFHVRTDMRGTRAARQPLKSFYLFTIVLHFTPKPRMKSRTAVTNEQAANQIHVQGAK